MHQLLQPVMNEGRNYLHLHADCNQEVSSPLEDKFATVRWRAREFRFVAACLALMLAKKPVFIAYLPIRLVSTASVKLGDISHMHA
jgi:hypothetical protein